jgi:hypothetical protein
MIERFRRAYGAGPLHLLALVASLLVAGAAVAGWFHNPASITIRILVWFLGAIIGHDLILLPLYSLFDRIAFGAMRGRGSCGEAPARASAWNYVRVPALLSGLLLLVFFPQILRLGEPTFRTASGLTQDVYLARYLLACGALFALAGLAYAVRLARTSRRLGPSRN